MRNRLWGRLADCRHDATLIKCCNRLFWTGDKAHSTGNWPTDTRKWCFLGIGVPNVSRLLYMAFTGSLQCNCVSLTMVFTHEFKAVITNSNVAALCVFVYLLFLLFIFFPSQFSFLALMSRKYIMAAIYLLSEISGRIKDCILVIVYIKFQLTAMCGPGQFPLIPLLSIFYFFPLSYVLHLFSCFLTPSHSTRIVPLHFQAGCRRRRLNLALVFVVCWFSVVYFLVKDACLFLSYLVYFCFAVW